MRKLATVARVALALVGGACATGAKRSPDVDGGAHYAARSTGRSSSGSAQFGNFVRARQPQLQFCYTEARRKHPKLAGSATVAVTLGDDGAVANAGIVRRSWSGKGGKDVEHCMIAKVRAWRFPPVEPDDPHVNSFAVIFSN
jgi:hypothetical protein